VILPSLEVRAVLFCSFYYGWLGICVVELFLLSLCVEAHNLMYSDQCNSSFLNMLLCLLKMVITDRNM
jgi:hypothetical protein